MADTKDPRTDQRDKPNDSRHPSPEVGPNKPYPAPGGAGTGTKGDPTPEKK